MLFKIESEVLLNLDIEKLKIGKSSLILEKSALFVSIHELNSYMKCFFKGALEKKTRKIFPMEPFCMSYMKCFLKCLYSKKPVLSCASVFLILTFHPNFYPNILVFANLPIYKRLMHDNISLVFCKPRIYCLPWFWMRYKIVCAYKYLH